MITKFTITGADNSIDPNELIRLSEKYPFVEWGILVSRKSFDTNRFPDKNWIYYLFQLQKRLKINFNLSCHICGAYAREICLGEDHFFGELFDVIPMFKRIQLNFHAVKHEWSDHMFDTLSDYCDHIQVIFQYDGVNNILLHKAYCHEAIINCAALFDLSHGAGVLPSEWPKPLKNIPCGYAGGLSPENLEENIIKINHLTGDVPVWIDMETHVRSDNDRLFDLAKVETCLKIASKYIKVRERLLL